MLKLTSTDFLGLFWNIIIFVFFRLIFNIHASQYEKGVFKQFCNPVLDLNRIIKSSAYNSEFISVPFGRTNESDSLFSNKYSKLVMRLDRRGLKIHP